MSDETATLVLELNARALTDKQRQDLENHFESADLVETDGFDGISLAILVATVAAHSLPKVLESLKLYYEIRELKFKIKSLEMAGKKVDVSNLESSGEPPSDE